MHKEFQGLKVPKKGGFRHGILGEIFVFGCLFGPEVWANCLRKLFSIGFIGVGGFGGWGSCL